MAAIAVAAWSDRPRRIAFAETIQEADAACTSTEQLGPGDAAKGLALTCDMVDRAPGNRDRPYVQVRFDGCDKWQRLDHDDGPGAVVVKTTVEPCGAPPAALQWQVCQTHGGPLPDDCHHAATELP